MNKQYRAEVEARWGSTKAYAEFQAKEKSCEGFDKSAEAMMALFAEIGQLRDGDPSDKVVQEKILALQTFITEHFYACTPEILRGLGEMYVGDDRFRRNIDQAGGEGTAEFVKRAIEIFADNR